MEKLKKYLALLNKEVQKLADGGAVAPAPMPAAPAPAPVAMPKMPSVSGTTNTSGSLSPLLKNTYGSYLKKQKHIPKIQKFQDGGKVEEQSPYEVGAEAKERREAILRNAGFGTQSPDEIQIEAEEKKQREVDQKPKYAEGGQVDSSQQKQYQSKAQFASPMYGYMGSSGTMNKGGKVQKLADGGFSLEELGQKLKEAFSDPEPPKSPEETREERNDRIRKENSERAQGKRSDYDPSQDKGYADGGDVKDYNDVGRRSKIMSTRDSEDQEMSNEIGDTKSEDLKSLLYKAKDKNRSESKEMLGYADGGDVEDRRASLKKLFPNKSDDEITSVMARADNPEQYVDSHPVSLPSTPTPTQDPSLDPYKKFAQYTQQQNYAMGGPIAVSDNPLKEPGVHSPVEKKYPINIGRIKPLNFKRRLKPIDIIKGYDEGGDVKKEYVEGDPQNINPSLLESQYSPEEAEAQKSADSTLDAQLQSQIDQHNDQHDLVQKINDALGDKPENDTQELPPARELAGTTVSKDEATDQDIKDAEDRMAERKKAAQEAPIPLEEEEKEPTEEEKPSKPSIMDRLADAQAQQRQATLINQLGNITDRMGASMGGFKPQNADIYEQNIKQAELPVEQLKQQIAMEPYDPNSDVSKAFKKYLQKFGGKDMMPDGPISAAMGKELMPFAFKDFEATQKAREIKENNQERLQERLMQTQMIVEGRKDVASQTNEMRREMMQNKADADQEKKEAKKQSDMDKYHAQTVQQLEQMRGSPAVSQAEKDIYSADKADSLMNIYGDPNKLSQRQVSLLSAEVAKIANGGVATMEELKNVTPNTLFGGKLSSFVENLINKPSPANAAKFVKQFKDYLDPLRKDAQQVIKDRYGRIIESRKKLIGDDHYQELQDNYLNRFKTPESSSASANIKQDPKILDYAQKYTNGDYNKASNILKARGYSGG